MGQLWPPHSDYGLDTDSPPDGYFNYLVVNVNVNVTLPGGFYLSSDLYDNSSSILITSSSNSTFLDAGIQRIQVWFPGFTIRASGIDGPYVVELYLFNDSFTYLGNDTYVTGSYLAVDFQAPPAEFSPPHSDHGLDTDSNGLFDYLLVDVVLNVSEAGYYEVDAGLFDSTGMTYITSSSNWSTFDLGLQTMELQFKGYQIYLSGIDGPYRVELELYDHRRNLLGNDTYMTAAYLCTDFEQNPPAVFSPPHSDYGLDTDGDLLYNFLIANIAVNVSRAGYYDIWGDLWDSAGTTYVTSDYNYTYLDIGIQTVELRFKGYEIYFAGVDGPYLLYLSLYDDGRDWLDEDTYMTAAYLYTDFEQGPPAVFSPPHSDYGLDTDGDSLYNYLVVDVVVAVDTPGTYTVDTSLWDNTSTVWIDGTSNTTFLDAGNRTVELRFSGYAIIGSGFDGPYVVRLWLYDSDWNWLDDDIRMTNPYLCSDFDPIPAEFSPPHSDYGLDTDGDTFFNFLVVNASVGVNESGTYLVYGVLYDITGSTEITNIMNITKLGVGLHSVPLRFSGATIYLSGFDGPYQVLLALFVLENGEVVMLDYDVYTTNPYGYTDFQPVNPAKIWGYVYNTTSGKPLPNATVEAINYSNGYDNSTTTNGTGYYEMDLFEGDFYVLMNAENMQSNLTVVSVVGSTEVTTTLEPSPPMNLSSIASFLSWDNVSLYVEMAMEEDNQTYRLMIDYMFGNQDGYVEQTELDSFVEFIGVPPAFSDNTTDMLYVDGIYYDFIPSSYLYSMTGEGPVTMKAPLYMSMSGNFTSNTTIPILQSHLIELNVTYDSHEKISIAYVNIPIDYFLEGFDPVRNVWITGLGTPAIVVDPLGNPNPASPVDYVWINLTVTTNADLTGPEIRDVFIDGSPVVTYNLSSLPATFDLTAVVDDTAARNSTIGGANYTMPTPTSWPGTPMNAVDTAFDEPVEEVVATINTPSVPGTYRYYVYAWDSVPNYNNSAPFATLVIVDDLPPEITGVAIDGQSTATYNFSTLPLTVQLTAVVDDIGLGGSNISGANYTTPTATSWPGTTMVAEDGAFDSPLENVTAIVIPPAQAGIYDYYVYAWDAGGVYNNSAPFATLLIVDDLPPEITGVAIDGQSTATYNLSSLPMNATLTATVNDTGLGGSDINGANYTTPTATSWPGTTMVAEDGAFDSPLEKITVQIALPAVPGTYYYYVYAWDAGGVYNNSAPFATLLIVDDLPPEISDVRAEPDPQGVGLDVVISANVTDVSGVAGVTIEIKDPDSVVLGNFSMTYNTTTARYEYSNAYNVTGIYNFTIWATDEAGNSASASGNFEIRAAVDSIPPEISDVRVDGQTTVTVKPGTDVSLAALIDDTNTGNSSIRGANYTIGMANWPGTPMDPTDGAFDSAQENVNLTIDTSGWADGSYQICVYARDNMQGVNLTSTACAEIVIDGTPPSISDVRAEPDPQEVGLDVVISANVTDVSGVAGVTIEIKDPDGTALGNFTMTYDAQNGKYQYSNAYDVDGIYNFTIWATDEAGNSASASGDFEIRKAAPLGFFEEFWWIIPIIVIIIVIIAIALVLLRKRKVSEEEVPPPPPPEEDVLEESPEETSEEPVKEDI